MKSESKHTAALCGNFPWLGAGIPAGLLQLARTSVSAFCILWLGLGSAQAATGSGNVFLQGNYVEVGIHPSGSFGTSIAPPAGFHARGGGGQLGFVADVGKDGWTTGTPDYIGDYFVPGSPEEGWGVEWTTPGGSEHTFGNFGLMGTVQIPATSLTETSSGNTRSAVWMGTATSGTESLQITQTVHYNVDDLFFVISVTMVNTGTTTLNSVEYMRNVDPDQEQPLAGGSYTTSNYVVNDNTTGQRLVVGKGTTYGSILGLGTIDSRAVVSTEGFSNRDPDAILDSPVTPSSASPIVADQAIALAYRFGSLAPGQSVSFDYAYILKESDLAVALGNLAAVSILQPTGTVSGNNVIFQATTDSVGTTTQMEFFINGTSIGVDTTPDAGGVFERTFDSSAYANGTLNLKVVATFTNGSTIEKSATVTVGNSGPPISFATPSAGSAFGGAGIPVSINVLDVNHPPVTVNFFRESASTGSVSLGQDSSAPFGTTFSVTDLPAGEGVIIKAVAADNLNRLTTIQVAGVVATQEIAVSGNGVDITSGDTTPSLADHTDFGSTLAVTGTVTRTFTISNSGGATLNLTGTPIIVLGGPGASAFSVTTQPAANTVPAGGGTRTFQITFQPATIGTSVATVSIANDDADENPFTFGISGTGLNSPPTDINLTSNSIAENSGANATIGTLSTIDPNGGSTFTYGLVDGDGSTDNSAFTLSGSSLLINASPDFETKSSYAIRVRSTDPGGLSFEKQFTITITNVNEPPVITSNGGGATASINVAENTTAVTTVTANDVDAGQTLTFTKSGADAALFTLTSGGVLTFTAAPDFEGAHGNTYAVTITVTDDGTGSLFDSQDLTITVTNVNEAPTISDIANLSINEDGSTGAIAFTIGDVDAGTIFSLSGTSDNTTLVPNGNIVFGGSGTNRTVTVTPAANLNGSVQITVTANDGALTASDTFTLTVTAVNDAPSFAISMAGGDASLNGLTVGGTTYYPAGGATVAVAPDLTYTNSVSPTTTGAQVSIDNGQSGDILSFNNSLASSYGISGNYNTTTKVLSFTGTATTSKYQDILRSVTYRNAVGTPTADRTISFNVGLNTLYNPSNGHFYEYVSSGTTWTNAYTLAAARTFQGMHGYLATVTSKVENDFIQTKLQADAWIGASDDVTYVNAALGSTVYASQAAVEGKWYWVTGPEAGTQFSQNNGNPVSVSSRYMNWRGGEPNNSGGENYAEFYLTGGWNDLPNLTLPYVVEYGGLAGDPVSTLSLTGSRTITYTPMALEDSGPFLAGSNFVTSISPGPNESGQTISFTVTNNDNSLFSVQPAISPSGALTFTPAPNAYGWCTVSVTAVDSGGVDNGGVNTSVTRSFILSIGPVNDAPIITSDGGGGTASISTAENTTAVTTVTATDVEVPATQTLTYSKSGPDAAKFTLNPATGVLAFTTAPDFENPGDVDHDNVYLVTVTVTDSNSPSASDSQDLSVTVTNVNETPVISSNSTAITVNEGSLASNSGTFRDAEGNATVTLTASIGSVTPNNGAGTWSWSYTPADGPDNSQTVTITATDNGSPALVSTTTFTLNVNNVAPTALAQSVTTNEDVAKVITLGAIDPGKDTLTFNIVTGPTPAQGTLSVISGNQVTFSPALNFNGNASFTFKATDSDDSESNIATVSITVDAVNDAPVVARNDATVTVDEGSQAQNTGSFSDADGNETATLSASIGTITQNNGAGTWSWSYTPADGPDASQTVTITATDNGSPALVSTTSFTLNVNNVAPTAVAQSVTTHEDTPKLITLSATDPGTDTQTFSIVTGPTQAQGTLSVISGNQLTFTPSSNFNGNASFTFKATDSDGAISNTATVSITVDPVNDVPSFAKGADQLLPPATTTAQSVSAWATLIDDGDPELTQALAFTVTEIGDSGLFTKAPAISSNGTLTYTPNGSAGTATFSVTLTDDAAAGGAALTTMAQTFTITVQPAADYSVTTVGNAILVTDVAGNGDTFTVSEPITGSIKFAASGRTFSVNGGLLIDSHSGSLPLVGINSITVNTAAGSDTINVEAFTGTLPSITINGGSSLDDSIHLTGAMTVGGDVELHASGSIIISDDVQSSGRTLLDANTVQIESDVLMQLTSALTITADVITIDPTATIDAGSNAVNLRQQTNAVAIDLGSTLDDTASTLELSDAELDRITAGTLNIGNANSGAIIVSAAITRPASTMMNLTSGASIDLTSGSINSGGGNVALTPGTSVFASNGGNDVTTGANGSLSIASGKSLKIAINGTNPDADFTQLNVAGKVDLTGVLLSLGGTHTPAAGQSFTIVNNDGADAITGTFSGYSEGSIVTLNGVPLVISYQGGSGNDVVLSYAPPVVASTNPSVTVNEGSIANNSGTFSDLQGNGTVALTASIGTVTPDAGTGSWSWTFATSDGPNETQTVTITADDGTNPSVSTTFALKVVNVAPTSSAQTVTTDEEVGKLITLGAMDPGDDTLNFSIVDGPTAAQGTLSVISGNQVTFTPALNFNGVATFTFKATDSDGEVGNTAMVTVRVNAINDTPSFTAGANLSIPAGSALQSVPWASDISAGAPDESGQALNFVVTNDNNSVFTVQPSISPTGVLTYQPSVAAGVSATVTVTLAETAIGGLSSAPSTFTISMTGAIGTGVFETLSTFRNSATGPKGPIVRDANGVLWGTTALGGLVNQGTIWQFSPGNQFHTVAELGGNATFNAKKGGGVQRGFDGNLYVTATGDTTGVGSVLRMSPDGSLSAVQTSTGGYTAASMILGSDGFLYGAIKGSLVKLAPTGGVVWSVKLPSGVDLRYPLLEWLDGNFYGTSVLGGSSNLGLIFKLTRTGQYTVVKNFTGNSSSGALGSRPSGALITGHDGAMYGVVSAHGASGTGAVFRLTNSGNYRLVASFPAGAGTPGNILFGTDGNYYGTRLSGTAGAIYKITPSGSLSTLLAFTGTTGGALGKVTSDTVESLVFGQDGLLYGATGQGGTGNGGVLFSVSTNGTYTVLHEMSASVNDPQGALADDSLGNVYGTNRTGGTGKGSIFKVAPDGALTDIYAFTGTDGSLPLSGLTLAADGNYYGTTSTGGTNNLGTVFRMTPSGVVTTVLSFTGTTGAYRGATPSGPLTLGPNNSLYGTTTIGGASNLGTVFRITNLGGVPVHTVLVNFTGKNGSNPVSGVVVDTDGKLLGTAKAGGSLSRGCVFKVVGPDTASPVQSVVASFTGTNGLVLGNSPQSTLIRGADGKFYGTTKQGGASDAGTVFRVSSAGVFESVVSFTNTTGAVIGKQPEGLVKGPDGRIYGATSLGGASGNGLVFAIDPATKAYTVRKQFEGESLGQQARGMPLLGRDGNVYGLSATTAWRMTFASQPTARTRLASNASPTSATLNGTVNANGLRTSVQFEYGPSIAYGATVNAAPATASGTTDTPVATPITGLQPGTVYHYRVVATGGGATSYGADQLLTTLNTAPDAPSDTIFTDTELSIVADPLPDPEGDLLDIFAVAPPAAGTLARNSATNVTYTPDLTLRTRGYDQFIYRTGDGLDASMPALLTVRYQPEGGSAPALPTDAVNLPTVAETYNAWATINLPVTVIGANRLADGDADADGISNGLECLMGLRPTVRDVSSLVIDTSGGNAFTKLRYNRQKGLMEGFETVEESTDGTSWHTVAHSRMLSKRTNGTITDAVEITITPLPGSAAARNFRLVVTP